MKIGPPNVAGRVTEATPRAAEAAPTPAPLAAPGSVRVGAAPTPAPPEIRRASTETAVRHLEAAAGLLGSGASRQDRARATSRLRQAMAILERVGPVEDPDLRARAGAVLPSVQGDGGKSSLGDLGRRLGSLFGIRAAAPVEGPAPDDPAAILEAHLSEAVRAFQAGDFEKVERMLRDEAVAERAGIRLDIRNIMIRTDPANVPAEEWDAMIMQIRLGSMSYVDGKVSMIVPSAFEIDDGELKTYDLPDDVRAQYTAIMLEEWMHQLQRHTGEPISRITAEYMADRDLPFDGLHEADIHAAFLEWGFDTERLGTVHAYRERAELEAWHRGRAGGPS